MLFMKQITIVTEMSFYGIKPLKKWGNDRQIMSTHRTLLLHEKNQTYL